MNYRNPKPTVDAIIAIGEGVVLVKRRNPPPGWALPGGFVDEGERLEDAALREVFEETGLRVTLDQLLYVYSDPARDPRQHTISVIFTAHGEGVPKGGDDAVCARVFSLDALPKDMAFDHASILQDYRLFLATGVRPSPRSFVTGSGGATGGSAGATGLAGS
jgi:8-oxo-dGTP diphosphatase